MTGDGLDDVVFLRTHTDGALSTTLKYFPSTGRTCGPSVTIDTSEIQRHITNLPVHKFHDMSFVFSQPN